MKGKPAEEKAAASRGGSEKGRDFSGPVLLFCLFRFRSPLFTFRPP